MNLLKQQVRKLEGLAKMTDKQRLDFLDKLAFKAGWGIRVHEAIYDIGPPLEMVVIQKSKCGKNWKSGHQTIRQAIDEYIKKNPSSRSD